MKRRFSFVITLFVALLAWSVPASADVIVDCSGMEEGDSCTNQGGEQGVCKMVNGSLSCEVEDDNADAGMADAGMADAGDEDAGPSDDAGMEDTGLSSGPGDGDGDAGDADEGCSTTASGPARTLLPLLVGIGLLAATRRRDR